VCSGTSQKQEVLQSLPNSNSSTGFPHQPVLCFPPKLLISAARVPSNLLAHLLRQSNLLGISKVELPSVQLPASQKERKTQKLTADLHGKLEKTIESLCLWSFCDRLADVLEHHQHDLLAVCCSKAIERLGNRLLILLTQNHLKQAIKTRVEV
jgi:hypothetical protein